MKFNYLKISAFELFCRICAMRIILAIVPRGAYDFVLLPISQLLLLGGILYWLWSIAVLIPNQLNMHDKTWRNPAKLFFILPVFYVPVAIIGSNTTLFHQFAGTGVQLSGFEIGLIFLILLSMASYFVILYFASKILNKFDELNGHKPVVPNLLLLVFWPIGMWFIQPRLNKIFNESPESK